MNFDYESIVRRKSSYDRRMYDRVAELERAKIANKEREKLLVRRNEVQDLLDFTDSYLYDLKKLVVTLETEGNNFKNRRIEYLNQIITDSLNEIFVDDPLRAKVRCDFSRTNEVNLELRDSDDNLLDPDMCSGKLQQYLISFASVAGITAGLGLKNLYVDEAFGVAAPEILGEIGKIIQNRIEQGLQVIMIAQNPGLYQDLPRKEIVLRKDPVTRAIEVVSETEY